VRRALGEGTSAEVFHAVDERDGLEVAIKLFPRTGVSEEEFRREASIAMRNVHPNLIRLVDAGVQDGRPWLALEYVDGINGRALVYREDRTVELVLEAMRQVFAGLDAMHGAGLVHGDVKPENVLIQDRHVRLADFGRTRLAHVLAGGRTHAGTPAYMHPSLFVGAAPSAATDCFAAWVMAYELLTGLRPWTRAELEGPRLPPCEPLPSETLNALLMAGLDGRLADARSGWLAISRFLAGRTDLPRPRLLPPPVRAEDVRRLVGLARREASCALIGHPDVTRPILEALDRAWRREGGTVVWMTPGWRRDLPLADALSMAADVAESLSGPHLAEIAAELGPLAHPLAAAVPATRAWLRASPSRSDRPEPERLALALRRMLAACPPPVLVLTRAFERVDGASRRLLREVVTEGSAALVAATPDPTHGLAAELRTPPLPDEPLDGAEARLGKAARLLLHQARVLDLPLDRTLARAVRSPTPQVVELAWDLEAIGAARWTGEEILARPGPLPGPEACTTILREAAAALDPRREPWLVARYALGGGDRQRLAEVIEPAIEAAMQRAPDEALLLCAADPRPPTASRLLTWFRVALLARDMAAADRVLALLREASDLGEADLAEAEGELHFRRGESQRAIAAYERAARALGRPVPGGLLGSWHDLRGLLQVLRARLPQPAPDPRLGRIFEALYDLRFSQDHAWLLRLHRLWLAAAPQDTRALAVEVLWRQLLGKREAADALQASLSERIREDEDPVGAAVLLMHRSMARLLRGETQAAFSDGVDAATRLLRAGDPYYAALAATLPTTCAIHVAGTGTLARIHHDLLALVEATGDERTARWADGIDAVLRWQQGDAQGAMERCRRWADEAGRRDDASEALARRFLAELHLERGAFEPAMLELEAADRVAKRLHVRMDYTDARVISMLVADGQARLAGHAGIKGRRAVERRMKALVSRFPRWEPRSLVALAMQAAAEGQPDRARALFAASTRGALDRGQAVDAWWALHLRSRALHDEEATEAAASLARAHNLHKGAQEPSPDVRRP
jgi:tetratricopeptide (TPR) repeat protein